MENILKNISSLRGVHYACIYREGEEPVSTFPDSLSDSMTLSYDLIDQIFAALKSINKSHNEIYFSIGEKFLVGYLMHETCVAILLTDKNINFPLVNMGIKSATTKIQRKIKAEQEAKIARLAPQPVVAEVNAAPPPTNKALQPILAELSTVLKQYLGPAAIFVFEDDVEKWKKSYVQSHENIPHLITILQKSLDPNKEQEEFVQRAQMIVESLR
ncbi:MAG: hypothetical protein KAG28_10350 [Cocleimonas sp.]|nr:hypothetical protein [Cocleimonas sp.]